MIDFGPVRLGPVFRMSSLRRGAALVAASLVLAGGSVTALGGVDDPPTPSEDAQRQPAEKPVDGRPDPKADPSLNVPGVTKVLEEQQKRPDPAAPVAPVGAGSAMPTIPAPVPGTSVIPGLSLSSVAMPRRKMYPEGTFLTGLGGTIVKAAGGEAIFVPDGTPGTRREPPMVLLPCATLGRLEGSAESAAGVVVSGQVFLYMGRQYLLPNNFTVRRATTEMTPAAAVASTPDAASPSAGAADVAELIRDLDAKRSEKRLLQPAKAGDAASEPAATDARVTPPSLVNEGTLIHDRRARFTRIDGEPAISFDGDAQSPAEPAMLVLRCRSLQRLEETIAKRGENLTLSVSGRVLVYGGRNYFLPTLVQIEPGSDVRPLQ